MSRTRLVAGMGVCATLVLGGGTAALPSCESDIGRFCLDDDADLSAEGIDACLEAHVAELDDGCGTYRAIVAACLVELAPGGVCPDASDAMPCLLQRVQPEQRSAACQAAIDASTVVAAADTSLRGTFWADGKRKLSEAELGQLNEDDAQVYRNWWKRKQKKSGSNSDVQYAIKKQKEEKQSKILKVQAQQAAQQALAGGASPKEATKVAYKTIRAKLKEGGDAFVAFTKDAIKDLATAATKLAQDAVKSAASREL